MKFLIMVCLLCTSQAFCQVYLNRGNGAEPDSLDIHQAQGLNSHNILFDMYEGLMTFDAHGKPAYGVAQSHQSRQHFTYWEFTLNPAAKWSDGQAVTAADFIRAWEVAIDPKTAAPYRQLFDNLTHQGKLNVSSEHDLHLAVTLNQPDAGFLNKLVLPVFYPKPTHTDQLAVSNGAFHLHQWDMQERITLHKNKHHHDQQNTQLDGVVYWVTEHQNSELLRFRADELDITETIPDSQIKWLRQHLSAQLRIAPYYGTFFLGLNLQQKHLQDLNLRRALSLAIDRDILVEKVLKTGQIPANSIIPPVNNEAKKSSGLDLKQARMLLKNSHFNPATDRLEILYNNSDNQKKVALAVAAMWRQNLGVKTSLRNQEWKVFIQTRKTNQKQVFRSGWIADYHDPLNFLELFHSESHFNFYAFDNQEYDGIVDQLRISFDTNKNQVLIDQAERILARNVPVIPLYHYVSRHLVKTNIDGYYDNDMDRHLSRYMSK